MINLRKRGFGLGEESSKRAIFVVLKFLVSKEEICLFFYLYNRNEDTSDFNNTLKGNFLVLFNVSLV